MKLKITRKQIVVKNSGYIRPLKVTGPIDSPIAIPLETIALLLQNGYKVYEVLKNGAEIKLDLINYDKINAGEENTTMSTTYEPRFSNNRKSVVTTITADDVEKRDISHILSESTKKLPNPKEPQSVAEDGKPVKHYVEDKKKDKQKPKVDEIEEK